MRLIFMGITFGIAVIVALVLVLTFIQPEFNTRVGAQLFAYKTRQLPVYYYIIGAFAAGLLIGIIQAISTFFRSRGKISQKDHHIRELETKLNDAHLRISGLETEAKLSEPTKPAPGNTGDPVEFLTMEI